MLADFLSNYKWKQDLEVRWGKRGFLLPSYGLKAHLSERKQALLWKTNTISLLPLCWAFFVVVLWGIRSRRAPLTFTLLCGIMTDIIWEKRGTARVGQRGDSWTSHQRGSHNGGQKSAQYWSQEDKMTQCHVCGHNAKIKKREKFFYAMIINTQSNFALNIYTQ